MPIIALLLGQLTTAHAIPIQFTQQGRLLDSSGTAVNGLNMMTFRLYDSQFGGAMHWEETLQVGFTEGYYMALLGDSGSNPLDDSILENNPLFLEVEVNGGGPIGLRQQLAATPYARLSGTATNLNGGNVDASQISIGGQQVIDANGSWVGPVMAANWGDVQNIPTDIADGDDDTLAGISCNAGEILGWNGTQWGCAADNGLTEAEVEAYVTNGPLDLDAATTVGGLPILTQGDGDTLSGLACQNGELAKYDMVLTQWVCDIDIDTDTQLSESDVEAYVVNDAIDLASGSMVNGNAILTDADVLAVDWANVLNVPADLADGDNDADTLAALSCADSEVPSWNAGTANWECAPAGINLSGCNSGDMLFYDSQTGSWSCSPGFDQDGDGVFAWNDCDDNNPNSLSSALDLDCDGVLPPDDCDNADPLSTTTATDADCDGALTADDCDDNNPNSNTIAVDADCDGAVTADDCDDNDPGRAPGIPETCNDGIDQDCDGYDDMSCVQLYAFSNHTFTTCGATGTTGPGVNACQMSYGTSWVNSTGYFDVNDGIQEWVVPKTGVYQIRAYGAAGGPNHCGDEGGYGAMMEGEFSLNSGDNLNLIVGQMGLISPSGNCWNGGGGGGGGTFVWLDGESLPLIAAGGGAGSNLINNGSPNYIGGPGLVTEAGGNARNGANGATGGNDANNGGGRGWLSITSSPNGQSGGGGYNADGGFGGGGGGGQGCGSHIGGGGAGYSGGATSNTCYYAGGGGGSYNAGSNQNQTEGVNGSHGQVNITFLY